MGAANLNLEIEQGADFQFSGQIQLPSGSYVDLTGSTLAGKIRAYAGAPTALATFTIQIDGLDNTKFNVSLTALQTAALPAPTTLANPKQKSVYVYDIEWTDTTPLKKRILEGKVTVSPEVTY